MFYPAGARPVREPWRAAAWSVGQRCWSTMAASREYELGPRNLRSGIYWARLIQAGRVSSARVAALRW